MKWNDNKYILIARWLTFLPLAAVAGIIAYLIGWHAMNLSLILTFGTETLMGKIYLKVFSSGLMGVTMVYIGCLLAPNYKKRVALIISALTLFLIGITSYKAYLMLDYWGILEEIAVAVGTVSFAVAILNDKVDL